MRGYRGKNKSLEEGGRKSHHGKDWKEEGVFYRTVGDSGTLTECENELSNEEGRADPRKKRFM